jgi:DNA-binding response OmpR family regulator
MIRQLLAPRSIPLVPKRKVLLVDDEVTVLLTMKAVLEISGFDVETAASAREGVHKLRTREYQMVITDMRMESDAAGREVIQAARHASYHPAVALLTAYPEEEFSEYGADKMLVKPMQTAALIHSIEQLMDRHAAKLTRLAEAASASTPTAAKKASTKKSPAKKSAKKSAGQKPALKKPAKKAAKPAAVTSAKKSAAKKTAAKKSANAAAKKSTTKKAAAR